MENTPTPSPAPTKVRDVWSQGKRLDAQIEKTKDKISALVIRLESLQAEKAALGAAIAGGK